MARARKARSRRGEPGAGRWRSASVRAKALALTVGGLALAWGVNAAMPGLVDRFHDLTGTPELEVTVLASDQFESELENTFVARFVWDESVDTVQRPEGRAAEGVATYESFPEAYGLGAADAQQSVLRVQLASKSGERININRVEVDVVSRDRPARELLVEPDGGLGGVVDIRYLTVDLDRERAQWTDGSGQTASAPTLFVQEGETETIDVSASAQDGDFRWRLVVTYSTEDGETGTEVVKPPWGDDFATTSLQNAARFVLGTSCTESRIPGPRLCGAWPAPDHATQPGWAATRATARPRR